MAVQRLFSSCRASFEMILASMQSRMLMDCLPSAAREPLSARRLMLPSRRFDAHEAQSLGLPLIAITPVSIEENTTSYNRAVMRKSGVPVVLHERLGPIVEGAGFALLPPPSAGDLFFDIEGDPFVEEGGADGLEYLFGVIEPGGLDAPDVMAAAGSEVSAEKAVRAVRHAKPAPTAPKPSATRPPAPHPKTEADAGRKKSFCARMGAVAREAKDGERAKAALKRWAC